ncbi:MAG: glycosyltransferase family 4 protein [Vulcanimicrobiaceae bacterium]
MRFAFVSHADPEDEALWSGIPVNIIRALRTLGHEVCPVGPLGAQYPLPARIKAAANRLLNKTYIINRNPQLFRARARRASDRVRRIGGVDAVIVTYPADAAYLHVDVPILVVHDSTWRQLLDFYPEFGSDRIAKETLRHAEQLERDALANADHLIYFSEWAARSAIDDYGIDSRKVSFAYPGASLRAVPSREAIGHAIQRRSSETCRLLFIGKDWHRKGGDIAVGIVERLNGLGIAAILDVVGCRPPREYARNRHVAMHGILHKSVSQDASLLESLLACAHFFVMPSRAECAGLVFCEAAAYGVPAVATDVGGIPEIVQNEVTGAALPKEAGPSDYAAWIAERFVDRDSYARMAWSARARFEQDLNWPSFCAAVIRTLRLSST